MKTYALLLTCLTTWLRPVAMLMWLGAALLAATLGLAAFGLRHEAFGTSIYAFTFLLALPYLLAWHPFRTMLGSRRLAQLPGFRLRLGLAMLLLTLLLALYLPLASMLLWPGAIGLNSALAIFIGASLFTFVMQWAVASPYVGVVFSIGPMLLVYVAARVWPVLLMAMTRDSNVGALVLASALGWGLALNVMDSRRAFLQPGKAPLLMREHVWTGRMDWLGVVLARHRGRVKTAAGTLLLGFPDGLAGRYAVNMSMLVVSPTVVGALLYILGLAPRAIPEPGHMAGLLLTFSLATSVFSSFGNGELAARARLLWLRESGDRSAQWRRLERRLALNLALLASLVVPITGVALMFPSITLDPLAYCLIALCGNLLGNYFSLAARLSQWSLFLQLLTVFVTGTALLIGFVIAALPLPVLVLILLGLALLFRQQAWLRFANVDWHRVRPVCQALKGATA